MARVRCPGLPASWVNGWLAAVGVTVLDSRIRLHWTADSTSFGACAVCCW